MTELFFNNAPLEDDRTIGFHEIQDGAIIETCSNPVWVSLLYAILGDFEVCSTGYIRTVGRMVCVLFRPLD